MVHGILRRWRAAGVTVRVVGVASALVLVAAMVAAVTAVDDELRDGFAAVTAGGDPPSPGQSQSSQSPTEGTTRDVAPTPAPAGGFGLLSTGVHLTATVDELGDVAVVERIAAAWPLTRLPLSPPAPPGSGAPAPRLVDLEVLANGNAVPLPWRGALDRDREIVLPAPTSRIELRYRVLGATARSKTAAPGRVTVSLRPAAAEAVAAAPAVVELLGTRVHALLCLQEPRSRQLCGIQGVDGWRTMPLTGASSQVLALIDLPDPGV